MSDDTPQQSPEAAPPDSALVRSLRGLFRSIGIGRSGDASLQDDLRDLIEQHPDGAQMDTEERALLLNLVKFGDLRVGDVMIPRADIVGLDLRSTIDEVVDVFQREFHSRIPIYREGLDHVIGMVHIKDLLKYWGKSDDFRLEDIVREVMFVPPSMPVADLLLNMRTRRIHMALVIDEYGGTDGLVTIEDLVEAIVGDIEDEHDEDEIDLIVEVSEGVLEVDGRADSVAVEEKLLVDLLPAELDEEVETIAGVVASLAGRVPQRGEVISHPHGVEFEVLQADARRIKRLRITKVAAGTAAANEIPPSR
ncbi:MAG: hemolysin family protein [Alphaproteobacteria bacterium]|jgi:CBS domain containing-hemolysin-like protein